MDRNGRGKMARSIRIPFSASGFFHTGLFPDITIHALICLASISQIRYRLSLCHFEESILGFALKNPILLELAFMHPSYKASFGTNPSHCRTTIANCGFFDFSAKSKKIARRRGFETLMDAMNLLLSDFSNETRKNFLFDNERLEFLGDAVIGFVVTVRLFYLFPYSNEGFFASCRSCLVRNETFAYFASWLGLEDYLLVCHVADSSNQMDINHALANSFEALMGAIYLDAGITLVDQVFSDIISKADIDNAEFFGIWTNPPDYILKNDFPFGDRHIIDSYPYLQELATFEESIGIYFHHIRILARAFTKRGKGDNFLTEGDNQTLEFLGDSVLQLMATTQLYRMFPYHNEGNLSILRSCLVSNNTQSLICDDLGLEKFLLNPDAETTESVGDIRKDKADLLEALIGAIFIDAGFDICQAFCDVCYFPRLKNFIISQSWNDPKSLLQQCCLMLRNEVKETPHVPKYRVVHQMGPTNAREYIAAVFINDKRLATGFGYNVREAEMDAAAQALLTHSDLFPASFMAKSLFALCNENKNDAKKELKKDNSNYDIEEMEDAEV
uniref:Uncharacterized protein n=1 Tax=Panagrolaimus superbus TaxID=310955 RepID=A0A914Y011_9BILA